MEKDLQKVYRTRYHDTARGALTGVIEKLQKDEATLVDVVAKTHMISKVQVDGYLDHYVDTLEAKERKCLADKQARQAKKYRDDLRIARTKAKKVLERMAIQHSEEHGSDSGSDEDDGVEEVPGPEGPAARPDKRHARFTTPLFEAVTPDIPQANMLYRDAAGSFRQLDSLREIRQMTKEEAISWFRVNLAGMHVKLEGKKNWADWVMQLRSALVDYRQTHVSAVSGLNYQFDTKLAKLMYQTVTTEIAEKLQASHTPADMFKVLELTYGTSATADVMKARGNAPFADQRYKLLLGREGPTDLLAEKLTKEEAAKAHFNLLEKESQDTIWVYSHGSRNSDRYTGAGWAVYHGAKRISKRMRKLGTSQIEIDEIRRILAKRKGGPEKLALDKPIGRIY
ncbi:putative double-stranded RNA/RNA-DNA hybrid binding protein [Ceratocystis lukuohia]|uniref:Double-stranded RNA/RNA-DNA hybrid binding protein n=1 Tax=Ceratocystis lukuohia TaxID=2019550 RepID=A0ABR4MR20_9PEZI